MCAPAFDATILSFLAIEWKLERGPFAGRLPSPIPFQKKKRCSFLVDLHIWHLVDMATFASIFTCSMTRVLVLCTPYIITE